eukprot:s1847_g2.t1
MALAGDVTSTSSTTTTTSYLPNHGLFPEVSEPVAGEFDTVWMMQLTNSERALLQESGVPTATVSRMETVLETMDRQQAEGRGAEGRWALGCFLHRATDGLEALDRIVGVLQRRLLPRGYVPIRRVPHNEQLRWSLLQWGRNQRDILQGTLDRHLDVGLIPADSELAPGEGHVGGGEYYAYNTRMLLLVVLLLLLSQWGHLPQLLMVVFMVFGLSHMRGRRGMMSKCEGRGEWKVFPGNGPFYDDHDHYIDLYLYLAGLLHVFYHCDVYRLGCRAFLFIEHSYIELSYMMVFCLLMKCGTCLFVGVKVSDHLLMINNQRTTKLPRTEYHRLMSSVRPLFFTLARCSEMAQQEIMATRIQLLYRMRQARKRVAEKRKMQAKVAKPKPPPPPQKSPKKEASSSAPAAEPEPPKPDPEEEGSPSQPLSQVVFFVFVPATVKKLGFKTNQLQSSEFRRRLASVRPLKLDFATGARFAASAGTGAKRLGFRLYARTAKAIAPPMALH